MPEFVDWNPSGLAYEVLSRLEDVVAAIRTLDRLEVVFVDAGSLHVKQVKKGFKVRTRAPEGVQLQAKQSSCVEAMTETVCKLGDKVVRYAARSTRARPIR